jgi:uncharacterized protein with ATP-grasp and redox domains
MPKSTDSKLIEKSIKSITNPKVDFILSSDLSEKEFKNIYSKIHSEFNNFIVNNAKLSESKLRGKKSIFKFKDNTVELIYNNDVVELIINGNKDIVSNIFGAKINNETKAVSDVKIDLSSLKKKISRLF